MKVSMNLTVAVIPIYGEICRFRLAKTKSGRYWSTFRKIRFRITVLDKIEFRLHRKCCISLNGVQHNLEQYSLGFNLIFVCTGIFVRNTEVVDVSFDNILHYNVDCVWFISVCCLAYRSIFYRLFKKSNLFISLFSKKLFT